MTISNKKCGEIFPSDFIYWRSLIQSCIFLETKSQTSEAVVWIINITQDSSTFFVVYKSRFVQSFGVLSTKFSRSRKGRPGILKGWSETIFMRDVINEHDFHYRCRWQNERPRDDDLILPKPPRYRVITFNACVHGRDDLHDWTV